MKLKATPKYSRKLLFGRFCFVAILVLLTLLPKIVSAESALGSALSGLIGIGDISASLIGWVAYVVSWILDTLLGVIILIQGYLLQMVLAINMGIVNSTMVRIGFPIALSFANLAFVLGIIVIAIATILNMQSYGIKNILWKLLVMAIAVNFGLIIAGGILSVSDNITLFFVNSALPGGAETAPQGESNVVQLAKFGSVITGSFNPQRTKLFNTADIVNQKEVRDLQAAWNASGKSLGEILKPIMAIFASVAVELIMIVIIGGLVVMLLYRYLALSIALIALPLAWAAWPFPALKKHFSKWWEQFLKQAFFTPIVVFFLWLAITVSTQIAAEGSRYSGHLTAIKGSGGVWGAVTNFFGGLFSPLIDTLVQTILVGGIMVAGVIAAEKFGAGFAKNTMAAVKEGGKGVQKRVLERAGRRYERAKQKVTQGAGALGGGLMGKLQQKMPAVRKALPILTGAGTRFKMALNDDGTAKTIPIPRLENGYFVDAQGNKLGKAVWDARNQDYTKNKSGDYLTSDNQVIDRGKLEYALVPYDENGKVLSRNLIDKDHKPIYGVKEGDKVVAAWVDKEGRPVDAPWVDRTTSGMRDAQITGRDTAEALRRKMLQEEKGLLADVFSGFGEGVSKGFKGSSSHDKALKNIKDALKAMEGDHGGGGGEAVTPAAPGGGGGAEHT